ncbi:peptidoglycan-binding protein [Terribacillus sp. JSM ZJ617]|uniref:peptidoglycan-binding domain-containing protein n=1 Tax=Terribacillus sp. JSM ZJ617 TaxID=3342119 RepID=UPI0035A8ED2A
MIHKDSGVFYFVVEPLGRYLWFGTEAAIKSFQKSKGIASDSVAGPNTYEKFFK